MSFRERLLSASSRVRFYPDPEPVVVVTPEPIPEPEPVAETPPNPEPVPEPVAEPEPEPEPKPVVRKTPWFQSVIATERTAREAAEMRAQIAERALEEVRKPPQVDADGKPVPTPEPVARPGETQTQFDARVRAEASRLVYQNEIDTKSNKINEDGKAAFSDWNDAVETLRVAGVLGDKAPPAFLDAVTRLDAAPKVLHHLGSNPEEATRLINLPPMAMVMELSKLDTKLGAVPAPSRAPKPIAPVVRGNSVRAGGLSDDMSIEEWMTEREKQIAQKRKRA